MSWNTNTPKTDKTAKNALKTLQIKKRPAGSRAPTPTRSHTRAHAHAHTRAPARTRAWTRTQDSFVLKTRLLQILFYKKSKIVQG